LNLLRTFPEYADEKFYLNREIQWIQFNRRVLYQASNKAIPLLERIKYLGIFTSNLDDFVMKRVGGLKRQVDFGISKKSHDGLSALEQLALIQVELKKDYDNISKIYKKNIISELTEHKIYIKKWKDLNEKQKQELKDYYESTIFPVLTPLVVDNALPFPFISNLTLSLALKLEHKETKEILFGRLKIPKVFPSLVELKESPDGLSYVSLLQVVSHNLEDLFPDTNILKVMPFRITRNADIEHDDEAAEDLLDTITEEIRQRRFAEAVRLEVGMNSDPWMIELLREELELSKEDIYEMSGLLDYNSLSDICNLPLPHLKFSSFDSVVPKELQDNQTSIFDIIKKNDILVHHPYESFTTSVERFVRSASEDENVLAIKMTLYRTNEKSSIISSLIHAAERGKQVVCLVELKARFDEERNIYWAQQMEKAGIHVVYGVLGFKTHCKTTLVLRKESHEIIAYAHIGSGNYNSITAKLYTDLGLLTCNKVITQDVIQLFHFLTGRSFKREFKSLYVAPMNMKARFLELIKNEILNAKLKKPARIIAKFNSLEDREMIRFLYAASNAGVQIDLIIRGLSCLKPGVKGLSENIRVISVVGRFLEHSRLFFFQNGEKDPLNGLFYVSSADWMRRNLHSRVEVAVPLLERTHKRKCYEILKMAMEDQVSGWLLNSSGEYTLRKTKTDKLGSQEQTMKLVALQSQTLDFTDNS
jgi:polyphosphate kinase